MNTMCDLATRLPLLIGRLLDRETLLHRGRFREETMTDILTGSLAAFAGPELIIQYPIEVMTGSDIDLRFWHVATGRDLYLRIQAKRLNAAFDGTKPVKIVHRAYRELLHKPPGSTAYQFETLAAAPAPFIPLYMFYNHASVVGDAHFAGAGPAVRGVNLAFAADIAREMKTKVAAAKARPRSIRHHKRLTHLRKHLFGLEAILCPGGISAGSSVPTPEAVSESLHEEWVGRNRPKISEDDVALRMFSEPRVMRPSGAVEPRPADGPAIRIDRNVEVPTITFISGRTDDGRTPVVTDDVDGRVR